MFLFLSTSVSSLTIPLLAVVIAIVAIRLLHLASQSVPPILYFNDSIFNRSILEFCPILQKPYVPTFLWGKSGHIQTILYGKKGRIKSPFPRGYRHSVVLSDGATVTFDIFEPLKVDPLKEDCTLLVCPGIANSSENEYIRTYVQFAQENGFRVSVLNHLGALKNLRLTAPRIYTYGGTEEYAAMVDEFISMHPHSKRIAVGFSMGANIVMKYLGEVKERQQKFIGAVSCCQGYDILEVFPHAMKWEHLRRMYVWAMTRHQIGILRFHSNVLFGAESQKIYGTFDEKKIFRTTSLFDIDKLYSHKRAGFKSLQDYYHSSSSRNYLDNIDIPVFFLNAFDDPLVPPEVHYIPQKHAFKRENVIFAVTLHGGHLGYFEGGIFIPDTVTWLDRVVVEYANALLKVSAASVNGTNEFNRQV